MCVCHMFSKVLTYLLTYLLDHAVRRRVRISVLQVADADIVAVTLNVMLLAWWQPCQIDRQADLTEVAC